MPKPQRDDTAEALERLAESLAAALDLAKDLATDELLDRLITAFRALPLQDRPAIVGILERAAASRALSRATEKAVGQETHVNPNARLYVRAHRSAIDERMFDRDEMMIADVRAMRIATLVRHVPAIYEVWTDALHEAVRHVDAATRAAAEQLLRDGLAAIAAAGASEPPAEPAAGGTGADADRDPDPAKKTS